MIIRDISMTIHPHMTVYKNKENKQPLFLKSADFETHGVYETDITMNLHTGTHIDFPLHTLKEGHNSDGHPLSTFIGTAKVFDLSQIDECISKADIEQLNIQKDDFILFKTRNSFRDDFDFNFVYLDESAAQYLANKKIRGVGIDSLGIERNQPNHPTHDTLLGAAIIILEGLRLKDISENNYEFICLPLKIAHVEALPVRAILIEK
jgi:arylformamidase